MQPARTEHDGRGHAQRMEAEFHDARIVFLPGQATGLRDNAVKSSSPEERLASPPVAR